MDRSMDAHFPGFKPLNISVIKIPDNCSPGIFKCRLLYDTKIRNIEFLPYSIKPIRSIRLVNADNLEYPYKYADRSGFEQLQKENPDVDEIILIKNGNITDTSYSNLAFLSGHKWFTPSEPLLNGTCRRRLIHHGVLTPIRISSNDLTKFSHVSLINAMLDLSDILLPVEAIEI